MPIQYTKSELSSPAASAAASQQTRQVVVNGKIYKKTSNAAQIQIALQGRNLKISSTIDINEAALMLLAEFDCGISNEPSNFTLTDDEAETIDNEKIMDEELYDSLSPEQMSPDQSFTDVNDPFYQLDDELPDKYQVQEAKDKAAKMPNFVKIAANITRIR